MAQLTRVALGDLATNTNVTTNGTKDNTALNVRDQYDNERDSTINIIDDKVLPKLSSGKNMLTYTNPPTLAELGADDLTTRTNVDDLLALLGGGYETVSFNVSSDAPVGDDIAFKDIINIDLASTILHPKLASATWESSTDGITFTSHATITILQTYITTNYSGLVYTIRPVSVYTVGQFGSATVGFKFNQ